MALRGVSLSDGSKMPWVFEGDLQPIQCPSWNFRKEDGQLYEATADDACYATSELEGGAIAQINSSWVTRVRRDDLVTFHVDGTQTIDFFGSWQDVPDAHVMDNGFKIQWEAFIRHVAEDAPYKWTLPEGAKGV
jgi:predicted dehydrogenase